MRRLGWVGILLWLCLRCCAKPRQYIIERRRWLIGCFLFFRFTLFAILLRTVSIVEAELSSVFFASGASRSRWLVRRRCRRGRGAELCPIELLVGVVGDSTSGLPCGHGNLAALIHSGGSRLVGHEMPDLRPHSRQPLFVVQTIRSRSHRIR